MLYSSLCKCFFLINLRKAAQQSSLKKVTYYIHNTLYSYCILALLLFYPILIRNALLEVYLSITKRVSVKKEPTQHFAEKCYTAEEFIWVEMYDPTSLWPQWSFDCLIGVNMHSCEYCTGFGLGGGGLWLQILCCSHSLWIKKVSKFLSKYF